MWLRRVLLRREVVLVFGLPMRKGTPYLLICYFLNNLLGIIPDYGHNLKRWLASYSYNSKQGLHRSWRVLGMRILQRLIRVYFFTAITKRLCFNVNILIAKEIFMTTTISERPQIRPDPQVELEPPFPPSDQEADVPQEHPHNRRLARFAAAGGAVIALSAIGVGLATQETTSDTPVGPAGPEPVPTITGWNQPQQGYSTEVSVPLQQTIPNGDMGADPSRVRITIHGTFPPQN
jgi:hypothetical protein